MKLSVRLNPEASQYFQKRIDEWHLNQTETLHKLIIEHKSNQEEIRVLKHDLDVMRQLINERPTQSQAEKKRIDYQTKKCLRGKRFPLDQAGHFCSICRANYLKEFEACQKLQAL